jgi:hypothetical protein
VEETLNEIHTSNPFCREIAAAAPPLNLELEHPSTTDSSSADKVYTQM